jgi:Family of unknown function (DUF6459)
MSSSRPTSAGEPRSRAAGPAVHVVLPLVPGFERAPGRRRPLPDAGAVRLVLVPDSAPPYDDGAAGTDPRPASAGSAGPQPGAPPGPPAPAVPPSAPAPATAAGPAGTPAPPARRDRPAPGSPRPQPPPAGWPSQFAQVLAETLAGSRPQDQIMPWTTDRARRVIRQLGPMLTTGTAPRVRRVVATRPAPGVVEMTVVVGCGPRIRAIAVRLERQESRRAAPGRDVAARRWVCTAIEAA